jgi:predicted DNA-binding WGR domain protein
MSAVHLRRVDAARNMRRFYQLDIEPDLFGGVLLLKSWGRIGARGRVVAERYENESLAADTLRCHAAETAARI